MGTKRLPDSRNNRIRKNINTIGNSTKIHDIMGAPALQIKFNTQVQNTTNNPFIKNTREVLLTAQT
jgi:hypothetical protein